MQIKGAIFDMDGTLLDSMPMWDGAADTLLAAYGKRMRPELPRKLLGLTVAQTVELLKVEYGLPGTVAQLEQQVNDQVRAYYFEKSTLKPGALQFLQQLQRQGVPMAVATATQKDLVLGGLGHTGIVPYFAAVTTCGEVGIGKQSPRVYQTAARLLGTPVEESWVFEDTLRTVTTAHEAGFKVAAVADPSSAADWQQMRELADLFITDWTKAADLFRD